MLEWYGISELESKNYVCGYCGRDITSNKGFITKSRNEKVYICHNCNGATYFNYKHEQTPRYLYGKVFEVEIPEDYHDKKNYTICLELEEAEPIFEPIKG